MPGVGSSTSEADAAPSARVRRGSIGSRAIANVPLVRYALLVVSVALIAASSLLAGGGVVDAAAAGPPELVTASTGRVFESAADVDDATREPESGALLNIGHAFRFGGAIVGLGALAALLWVLHSDKEDLRVVLGVARMMGLVVATGAALEWASYQQVSGDGLGALVRSATGWALTLAMVGGVLITFGLTERRSLTPAGPNFRWSPGRSSALGLIGAVAVVASFGFDGHRGAVGPTVVTVIADLVHVATAALWGGVVCVLALVGLLRARRGRRIGLVASTVRFSAIAPWSLLALVASGVAMTVTISGADTQTFSDPWGRTLLVKVILVAIAFAVGLFNRIALLPRLRGGDVDELTIGQMRVVLTAEAVFVLMATIVTVALVQLVP